MDSIKDIFLIGYLSTLLIDGFSCVGICFFAGLVYRIMEKLLVHLFGYFIKVGVVSADVNVFLEDLISFMFELSLSWNSQFISWKFIFSTILNKSFWSCSKNLMGDGVLTIVACIILLKIKSFPSHSLYHGFSLFKQF